MVQIIQSYNSGTMQDLLSETFLKTFYTREAQTQNQINQTQSACEAPPSGAGELQNKQHELTGERARGLTLQGWSPTPGAAAW